MAFDVVMFPRGRVSFAALRNQGEPMSEDTQLLLSPERAADRMDVGRSKIFELMAAGELESVRIGRSRRIPLDALKAYIEGLRANQETRAAS